MKRKLYYSLLLILLLILVMIAGNLVIMNFYKHTTDKLILEYHELYALQDYKMALGKIQLSINDLVNKNDDINKDKLTEAIQTSFKKKDVCLVVITENHSDLKCFESHSSLEQFSSSLTQKLKTDDIPETRQLNSYHQLIEENISNLDDMVNETDHEIKDAETRIRFIKLHGSLTILLVSVVLILFISVGSHFLIGNITKPISVLIKATQKISGGQRNIRIEQLKEKEFNHLAVSFNEMLDMVESTTVSITYLQNIINNIRGILLVTDENCSITIANKFSCELLGYSEQELIGKDALQLFLTNEKGVNLESKMLTLEECRLLIQSCQTMNRKNPGKIPVLSTCSLLKNRDQKNDGIVIACYDLTERLTYEQTIEQIRRENLIAINEAQEVERLRIATDIHDGLGQMLTSIFYAVQKLEEKDETKKTENSIERRILQLISQAIQESRNLAHDLIPIILKDFGLVAAIQNLVDKANQLHQTRFAFSHYDFYDRLRPNLEKSLFRICQEAINNIIKHAKAKSANFQLFLTEQTVVLTIDDDGIGFDMKNFEGWNKNPGIGLISIRERVRAFNGSVAIDSGPGMGTEILIEIPLKN